MRYSADNLVSGKDQKIGPAPNAHNYLTHKRLETIFGVLFKSPKKPLPGFYSESRNNTPY
jgi:hypothetical protein